jgi:sensor c-di-GMP phosphodiesterase-like protein
VKIAKEFTAEIGSDPGSVCIVKAIAALARELGMVALVEGIENSEQLGISRGLHVPRGSRLLFFAATCSQRDFFNPATGSRWGQI